MVKERRKAFVGRVVSDKMDKTIMVQVETLRRDPLYKKVMRRRKKFMAHDEENACQIGDLVRIQECRPLSRHKRWRLIAVLERAAEHAGAVMPAAGLDETDPALVGLSSEDEDASEDDA